jgi:multidrug efflux pump subunit AcrB
MSKITAIILKRPVSAIAIILAIIIFGVFSAGSMDQELTPEMNMPMMLVQTTYIGASPEDVEKLVSSKIEGELGSLSGVKHITSQSMENASVIVLQYEYGVDMDTAYIDLMERVNRVSGTFPDDVGTPVIMEMNMNAADSVTLSVQSEGRSNLLDYVEQELVPEFKKLSSVAEVVVSGGQEPYIRVELQEEKLKQYGVTMNTVIGSVASADYSMPNGNIDFGSQNASVRSAVEYKTTESLKNIPISLGGGGSIRLADVANIYDAYKDSDSISRYNGLDNITIGIQKRQSASAVNVSRQVMSVVDELRAVDPTIGIEVVNDQKDMIQESLMSVVETLILAMAIAMIVIFLFLGDLRASLIIGSSIPVSLLVAMIMMNFMGFTLNIVTLSAMVMGVGMMTDNSIVVLDSIFKSTDGKRTPREAALEGAKFVLGSIIGSSLTTIVVFLPLAMLKGMAGQMLAPLGYTVVFALIASLISAISFVPLFFVQFNPRENENAPVARLLKKIERGYGRLLEKLLPKKKTVFAVSISFVVLSVFLAGQLNVELIASADEATIGITAEMRPGLRLESANEIITDLEKMVAAHPDVDRYITTIDGNGSITAYLKDKSEMDTQEVVEQWRQESKDIRDCNLTIEALSQTSEITSDDAEIILKGNDLDILREEAVKIEEIFRAHPDILNVSSNLEAGNPQVQVVVDPVKASSVGLTPAQISGTIGMALSGVEASTLNRDGHEYPIRVEYPDDRYKEMTALRGMMIIAPTGVSVPLTDIAEIRMTNAPVTIMKEDNQYLVTVSGTPKESAKYTAQAEIDAQFEKLSFPEGVTRATSSMDSMQSEEVSGLLLAIVAAILLVFLVMTIQFESFKYSLMVMVCIPFSLIGSFAFMYLANATISMVSLLGFLVLIGTVVNNGILFVDTANEYRKSMDLRAALVQTATHRLRPIMMTALTMVLSMIPLALAIGTGAEMMQGLGIVVIGGMFAAMLLTLLFLPTFYLIIDGIGFKRRKKKETSIPIPAIETEATL